MNVGVDSPLNRPNTAPASLAQAQSSFISAVAENWDSFGFDERGSLSQARLDTLMKDPSVHKELAAQVAALDEMSAGKGVTVKQLESYAESYQDDPQKNNNFDHEYGWYLSRVEGQNHALFAHDTPDYNAVAQGNLGDCYLLAAISGEARLHPDKIVSMISAANGNADYLVHFPGLAKAVEVAAPTDTEMARYGTSGSDGTWASVLEKAYAQSQAKPDTDDPYTAIATGGTTEGVQLMTGDRVNSVHLEGSSQHRWNPFHDSQSSESEDRKNVEAALANGQLATISTDHAADGVTESHMLTLESYDAETDSITVRNPWGWEPSADQVTDLGRGEFRLKFDEFEKTFRFLDYQVA